jgi:ubiquitin-activating enzyme E1
LQLPEKKVEDFKNGFANLALPFISFSEPIAAPKKVVGVKQLEWTLWDRFEVDEGRELTLREFLDLFKSRHALEITMISCGVSILYSFFTAARKLNERMPMTMGQLVVEVSKVELKPNRRYLTFEICANDVEDDEDVEVPYIRYARF